MSEDNEDAGTDFVDAVAEQLPESLTEQQIVRLVCGVIAGYATGPIDALHFIRAVAIRLKRHYAEQVEAGEMECDCPRCRAQRGQVH